MLDNRWKQSKCQVISRWGLYDLAREAAKEREKEKGLLHVVMTCEPVIQQGYSPLLQYYIQIAGPSVFWLPSPE